MKKLATLKRGGEMLHAACFSLHIRVYTSQIETLCFIYIKPEIAANCEKYIRAKDTQVCLMIFHQNSN